ncbi:6-carboxytetrahydropterin synthase QueD [Sediminibacillus albus]|uniref:6-carboxy-5,6,7,8-tetrahydropterin synthase n=1 Tax=Sediminibacillus albus TaxID=407036 RepID=A0A1G8X0Z3_9BACI|nr:6-carboxytetrahydropterin synthase QueD [Sediminibacillus albus]SDJ84007.1 6-pyruvoyltetrahydropterin/6-carboxytetrahydropterin synthase [Sediminibacillus albus]
MEGYGFTIVEKLEKLGEDIQKEQLKYHTKRVLVSKEFTFDSAHHLHCYEGKCKNLHGHTYRVVFGISGYTDEIGMVIDFGDIKVLWKEEIEVYLDHRYLNETLPAMNTTAENIVVWIYEKMAAALRERIDSNLRLEYIKLYETPGSFAEVRREWMEDE